MGSCWSTMSESTEQKHFCKDKCLINYDEFPTDELLKCLQNYDVEFILNIIMKYLPNYDLQEMDKSYFHQQSLLYYNDNLQPCSFWKNGLIEIKIGILGNRGSGKTCLIHRFVYDKFLKIYDPTIEGIETKEISINFTNVLFKIFNPIGMDEYYMELLIDSLIEETHFFLICYDKSLNDKKSIENIKVYKDRIFKIKYKDNKDTDWGMMIVATKCDLINNNDDNINNNNQEIINYAKNLNIPYIETSSKNKTNILLTFQQILYEFWMQSQTNCLYLNYD